MQIAGPFALRLVGKQPGEAGIGFKRNDIEGDQPRPGERQRAQDGIGLCYISAFEHQHGAGLIVPEIELTQHACLVKLPHSERLRFQVGRERFAGSAWDLPFERQDFHSLDPFPGNSLSATSGAYFRAISLLMLCVLAISL